MNVGRTDPGTFMPKEWAASGALLPISGLEVQFEGEHAYDCDERRMIGAPEDSYRLRVLSSGKYTGASGEKEVYALPHGVWSVMETGPFFYRLRFYLDFPDGAIRNDVELPAGRVFFTYRSDNGELMQGSGQKGGGLSVKRVRPFTDALRDIGSGPKMQWGEALFSLGRFTMTRSDS